GGQRQHGGLLHQRRPRDVVQLRGPVRAKGQDQLLLCARSPNRRADRLGQPHVGDPPMRWRKQVPAAFTILLSALHAQTLRPLHVSAGGQILDDANKVVALRGLNRSATGSGSADAAASDADYAAGNQLLSMNLVRIFVNAAWWNNNVQVPIANQNYQTYIDG